MNKLIIYTALFGKYDILREPTQKFDGCEFVCFTDQKDLVSEIWEIRYVEDVTRSPILQNRYYKFFPHLIFDNYKYSLYVDANISICANPLDLIDKYMTGDSFIACPRHFLRDCIYDEAEECIKNGIGRESEIRRLIFDYKSECFPEHYGLAENNIIIRVHSSPYLKCLMDEWWFHINNGPLRDQLSLMYICWKNNCKLKFISESARNGNKYFKYNLHLHDKESGRIRFILRYIKANEQRRFIYYLASKIILFLKGF